MERQQVTQTNQGDHRRETPLFAKPALLSRAPVYPFLQLQRTIGNRATGHFIQAKLKVNQPGDVYEQEADHVADEVMRMPEPTSHDISPHSSPAIQRKCAACASGGGTCPECAEEEKMMQRKPLAAQITPLIQRQVLETSEEEEETVQAKEVAGATPVITPAVESHINNMRGGGQPLPESVRAFFEPRLGYDFSQVHIHTNTQASQLARSINARAFTAGSDVVFGTGEYAPQTTEGRKLMAHELTHVVQQRGDNTVVRRWAVGPAPAPAGWSVVTDAEQLRRLNQAEDIVRGVLTSRRCQSFFSSGCRTANALQDAFDNARVYLIPVDDNVFGARQRPGADIAFNLRAFRIGRFMMASTLLHEMFHTCDPTIDQNTRELNSENAVEACRLHTPWIDEVSPQRAAAGRRVTIRGWGFGPVRSGLDEVRIGGISATIVSWDFMTDTSSRVEIVVEAPAGAGAGGVVVINNGVESNTAVFTMV